MFVGTPPFGYQCTDDHESNKTRYWKPPRTPPCGMAYREIHHPGAAASWPRDDSESGLRPKSRFPDLDVPEMKLTDVVPALFSSPKLGSKIIQASDEHPQTCRSDLRDMRYESEPCDNPSDKDRAIVGGWLIDREYEKLNWLTCKIQGPCWGTVLSPCHLCRIL